MTLTEFLLARIAEDEAWGRHDEGDPAADLPTVRTGMCGADAERVLAECKAKRRIVEREASYGPTDGFPVVTAILATVYADHPDYREEWKP